LIHQFKGHIPRTSQSGRENMSEQTVTMTLDEVLTFARGRRT
jgi:hypothetical protein